MNASQKNYGKCEKTEILKKNKRKVKKKKKPIWCQKKLSYYKVFHRKYISKRNEKKPEVLMNKPVCLGLSIPEFS